MDVGFKLIKFTNYGTELLNGEIYLNSLEYYRGIEEVISGNLSNINKRNTAINDYLEGSIASVNPNDLNKFGLNWGKEITEAIVGNVHLLSENLKYLKIFCLYMLFYFPKHKKVIMPSWKIKEFGCKYAVVINDASEFIKRIINYLDENNGLNKIVAFKGDSVRYYHNDTQTKMLSVFDKEFRFRWENEYRLIFPEQSANLDPIILNIGDISDIATLVTVEELMNVPQKLFPNYTFVFDDENS